MDGPVFGILGPLSVGRPGSEIRLPGARRRVLLVRLLVSANEVVSAGRLIEDLWDGEPPGGAPSTLQSHISALRHVLGRERVEHRDGGYVATVADGELDVQLFQRDTTAAQRAGSEGDLVSAAELWSHALGRWRGPALADATGMGWAVGEASGLEEQRTVALEAWLDARLELGDHAGVASDAERAVAEHPLREGLWAKLMVSLYRSGRQSEALRAYRRVRALLGEELGIDPSPELAGLEQAILLHRPELQWQPPRSVECIAVRANGALSASPTALGSRDLPSGTVTFLAAHIEESSGLLGDLGPEYAGVLRRHRELLRAAVAAEGGAEVHVAGDGCLFAFSGTSSAITAAIAAQEALSSEHWPKGVSPAVQMALHTGEASPDEGDYVALAVNQTTEMARAAHGGQLVVSDATAVVGALPAGVSVRDLGVYHFKTFDVPIRAHQLCGDGLSTGFPRLRARPAIVGNLPAAVSSFVGRSDEVAQTTKLVRAHRLVTLIGPGGTGKTRLALEAGRQLDDFVDGVWFVDLAPVSDPYRIAAVVADTVGVRQQADQPLTETLTRWVSDQRVLLIFDNCEHVIQASAELIERLLTSGANAKVLATSRERLRISGEAVWNVPPLALPDSSAGSDIDAAIYSDAVRLFVDRALAARSDQPLDRPAISAIADIVVRLDGLPLAIELAAARVDQLSVRHIADRLDDRFRLLVEGSRTALPRHQTLRGAIDWSFQLLAPQEQTAFARLSVFAGSFTSQAATSVAADQQLPARDLGDIIDALTAKSLLVRANPSGAAHLSHLGSVEPRFRLLETIREYAADQLELVGDDEAARLRGSHGDYYFKLAEAAEPSLYGPDQGRLLAALELEHDNLRLVLDRFATRPERRSDLLRMVSALRRFWHTHNHHGECLSYLEPALQQVDGDVPADVRAAALNLAAEVVRFSDAAAASRYGHDALILARALGDDVVASRTLSVCGIAFVPAVLPLTTVFRGEPETARSLAEEAVEVAYKARDPVVIGEALVAHGIVAHDDLAFSRRLNEEAIRAAERSGDVGNAAWAHNNLGCGLLAVGDIDGARAHIEMAIATFADLDSENAMALINLGWVYLQQGDVPTATATFIKAMRLARRSAKRTDQAYATLGSALCATANGQEARAAALHAFADQEVAEMGLTWTEPEHSYRSRDLDRLRANLGARFDAAYASARNTSRDRLVQLVLNPAGDSDVLADHTCTV